MIVFVKVVGGCHFLKSREFYRDEILQICNEHVLVKVEWKRDHRMFKILLDYTIHTLRLSPPPQLSPP